MLSVRTFLFTISLITLFACNREQEKKSPPAVPVTILKVEPKTVPAIFEYVGFAQSSHLVEIRARIEGYLDKIAYNEGGMIKKGDLMFVIDPRPYEAALQQEMGLLKREEALLWESQKAVERFRPLYEKKAASQRDLDDAIASQLAREADVYSANAKLTAAKVNLSYTQILSPITGLTNRSTYREGALISPGPNDKLTQVAVLDPIWVYFNISEFDLLKGKKLIKDNLLVYPEEMDFDVELILADNSIYPHKGKVNFTSPTLDQKTGTMTVRAVFPNPDNAIIPGQFVRARVMGADRPNVMIVPQKAVLQGRTGMFVFLVNKDNEAAIQYIEPGDWYEKNWVINGGLKSGDHVVVDGINKIREGSLVQVTKVLTEDDILMDKQ